jgi:hypothetical protein
LLSDDETAHHFYVFGLPETLQEMFKLGYEQREHTAFNIAKLARSRM